MAEKLTQEQVQKIASLAQIQLTPAELEKYPKQLLAILEYVDILQNVDTKTIEPTAQVTGMTNRMRQDEVKPSLSQAEALANAPEKMRGYFKIKAVL
jgi:aspartyl-tRNA(Asn)/glutamyl-tRNA(Gln) amidotransferase subunit C